MYGNKRLTPMFEDYVKYKTSLSRKLINFYNKVEFGEVDILPSNTEDLNSILYGTFHNKGNFKLLKSGFLDIKNNDFIFNLEIDQNTNNSVVDYRTTSNILIALKNKNLIINFKCD
jgi:hypothetical protein